MSNFIVSARKYRPVNFDTVVGQPSVTNTLKNAIRSHQTAHAYLFCGPRGVGKTTCARIFAKTLNCFNLSPEIEACDQCESCKSFNESRSFNIHELDAASNNSVDDIRSLIDKVRIIPQVGRYSIYIIDEVHMLSQAAFNAFLKTLEEPPEHAIFILATTEKHKIIPTILSRCQIFDFHRIRIEDIVAYLAKVAGLENIAFEEEALNVIALKADGAMRDALSIFDQVASFSNRNITYREVLDNLNVLDYEYFFKITENFLAGSANKALLLFNEILQRGFDGQNFVGGLASHFRDLLVSHDESTLSLLEVSDVLKSRYKQQALLCSSEFLFRALEITSQCELSFKASRNQRLHVELSLIRLANIVAEKKNLNSEQEILIIPEIIKSGENKKPVQQIVEQYIKPVAPPATETIPVSEKVPMVKESAKPYDSPSTISIKNALKSVGSVGTTNNSNETDAESETEEMNTSDYEDKPFSEEALIQQWNIYAAKIREDKPRMAVTLKSVTPKVIEKGVISLDLNNRSQLDDFNNNTKNELEKFLQQELQNMSITIEARIIETQESQQVKLYTSEEKFKYLSQKNPALTTFKQKLNLELE
jgi:DNA polymerase-3 subunit gamma/tau